MPRITQSDLQAYLDEALSPAEMTAIEAELRKKPDLLKQLSAINARQRLSCPTREQLGSYLLGALDGSHTEYIDFHLKTVGCRYCHANLDDLRRQQEETAETTKTRRTKYFQSTAGHLRRKK
jgi:hypothetical protein